MDKKLFHKRYKAMCKKLDAMTREERKAYFEKQFEKNRNDPNTWGNILGNAGLLQHLDPRNMEEMKPK